MSQYAYRSHDNLPRHCTPPGPSYITKYIMYCGQSETVTSPFSENKLPCRVPIAVPPRNRHVQRARCERPADPFMKGASKIKVGLAISVTFGGNDTIEEGKRNDTASKASRKSRTIRIGTKVVPGQLLRNRLNSSGAHVAYAYPN